ncbi:MAG TPA: mannonate dehydratase [Puia sp.]|nr:mannonate dehydratase [Puia sp.]
MKDRRAFIKKSATLAALSMGGVGAATAGMLHPAQTSADPASTPEPAKAASPKPSRIRIAVQSSPEPTDVNISFYKQMGLNDVVLWTGPDKASAEYYSSRKQLFADHGMEVYGFGDTAVHNSDIIVLNLPGRDAKIEEYKNHLRNLGKAGIHYTTYAHMANGIWDSDERGVARGGASARDFNLNAPNHGRWEQRRFDGPLTHGRKYSRDELWANYEYFIKAVVATAEENKVRIGIHPDDPPVPELGGIPRLFSSFDGYKKAIEIANSPNVGLCLCVGSWMEGGDQLGKDAVGMIDYFGQQKKIFKIHFRNVYSPLPHFIESFVDDGYTDMYKIMQALKRVDFDGVIIPDHIPNMAGGPNVGTAYTIGYMKALLNRVNAEV